MSLLATDQPQEPLYKQLTVLELRQRVREHLNQLRTSVPVAKRKVSTKAPKENLEELMIHWSALREERKRKDYKEVYLDMYLDFVAMVTSSSIPYDQASEHLKNNKVGWDSVLYSKYLQEELKNIINLTKRPDVVEGMFTCDVCKSKKTFSYSRQVRSADEPATIFVNCANKACQHRWRIN